MRLRLPRVSPTALVAAVVAALYAVAAVHPALLTDHSPIATVPTAALRAPSRAHLLGTDQLGRDVLARVVHGARPSLLIAVGATVLALAGATILGLLAALGGRVADQVTMRAADVALALPGMLTALLAVTVLGTGTVNVMLAVAVAFVPGLARLVRADAMVVARSGYVEAGVGVGLSRPALVVRHVLPNAIGSVLVLATVSFGTAIIDASGLSFLGLGAQPPSPEWGSMLSEGRSYLSRAWWVGVFPGLAITGAVVAANVLGRRARLRFSRRSA